jgi:hypothetical protein
MKEIIITKEINSAKLMDELLAAGLIAPVKDDGTSTVHGNAVYVTDNADEAAIQAVIAAHDPAPAPDKVREITYSTEKVISWQGQMLTVDEARAAWLLYAPEGSPKADELTALIQAAKASVRTQYPDKPLKDG